MAIRTAYTPMQALVKALHKVQPPVLMGGVTITQEPDMVETVIVTFHMSPELVKEWGEECAKLCHELPVLHTGEAVVPKVNPIQQPRD